MYRKLIITLLLMPVVNNCFCQSLIIKTNPNDREHIVNNGIVDGEFSKPINVLHFFIHETPSKTYEVKINNETKGSFNSDGTFHAIDFQTDISDELISIFNNGNEVNSFKIGLSNDDLEGSYNKITADQYFATLFREVHVTNYGIQILDLNNQNTQFKGKDYVHIFLDQNGNPLISTIPQGMSNMQYVVHLFYLTNESNPNRIDYSVDQTQGKFDGSILFNNTGVLSDLELRSASTEEREEISYVWKHKEILLSTSTTDIKFEVQRNILKESSDYFAIDKKVLSSFEIPMSKVYHGTFEIGILNSTLSNPSFELVESPSSSSDYVVKKGNDNNRGYMTAMATFYTSPIILIESLFGFDIPRHKLTGRNFLDVNKIYENIYPSIGIGLTDKSFENLFFGLTWEFARGGSFWGGYHYGKINVFDEFDGFVFNETVVSESEFILRTDSEWKNSLAFGINLDIKLVTNLFK